MQHPISYITVSIIAAIFILGIFQLITHQFNQPMLWWAFISILTATIIRLSISTLRYARKLIA